MKSYCGIAVAGALLLLGGCGGNRSQSPDAPVGDVKVTGITSGK